MNSTTHAVVGGLTGGLVAAQAIANHTATLGFHGYYIFPAAVVAGAIIGGISPDIDMQRSVSGRFFRRVLRGAILLSVAFLALMYLLPRTGIGFIDNAMAAGHGIDKTYPILLAAFGLGLLFIVEKANHRGFTHTLVALIIVAAPAIFMIARGIQFNGANLVMSVQVGFVLGWLSHMVIDTFNYPGTPWLWPLTSNHFNIARIDSGTGQETAFCTVCTVLFIIAYVMII